MSLVSVKTEIVRGVPSEAQINTIPLARCGTFELSDKECANTRRFLYGINKDGVRRYRTTREGSLLFVWRIK